jgi:fructose-bisphosphate aldolase/2-amino-3,7-dideoxy-D-threo-hept-6-ulosonate synthase
MSHIGKDVRLANIINRKSGKQVCIAMDHSPAIGPVEGLVDVSTAIRSVCAGKPDTIFAHYGIIRKTLPILIDAQVPFLLSISTATTLSPDPSHVFLVDSVLHAVQIGASGVSMRIFVGSEHEVDMLKDLSFVIAECEQYGMPVMAMMYPYGQADNFAPKVLKHAARIGAELGADIVKTYYSGDAESFSEVTASCPVPIVMSGGPKAENSVDFLSNLRGAIDGGALGVAVGRNAWQHEEPASMIQAIKNVVHNGLPAQKAFDAVFGELEA